MTITAKEALDICQRNLDKWYISDPYWEDAYEYWYWSCIKDMANLILWDDGDYWVKDKYLSSWK